MTRSGYYEGERGPLSAYDLRTLPTGAIITRHSHLREDGPFQKMVRTVHLNTDMPIIRGSRSGRLLDWDQVTDSAHTGHPEVRVPPMAINYVFTLGEVDKAPCGRRGRPPGYKNALKVQVTPGWLKNEAIHPKPKAPNKGKRNRWFA